METDLLVVNGRIMPMDGPGFLSGWVHIRDGKFVDIGDMAELPEMDCEKLDADGGYVLPGLIDAHCHVGVFGDGGGIESEDGNEATDPCTPHLRAIDAINPFDRCFVDAAQAGITTVLTGPGSANPVCGQIAAIKTVGICVDEMIVAAPAAMKMALGENPKMVRDDKTAPKTRMSTAAIIREQLAKADEYNRKCETSVNDPEFDPPDFDIKREAMRPLLCRDISAHIHCHRADDICTAVRLSKEFDIKYVLVHATEGHLVADYLAEHNVSAIVGPLLTDRSKPELRNLSFSNPAALHRAGVLVALCTDHPVTPINYLMLCAALANKEGLPEDAALRAVTINPAVIAGIDEHVGSISPGKDADLVIYDRHPFKMSSRVTNVLIGGVSVDL